MIYIGQWCAFKSNGHSKIVSSFGELQTSLFSLSRGRLTKEWMCKISTQNYSIFRI
jgi:hypothetical protein